MFVKRGLKFCKIILTEIKYRYIWQKKIKVKKGILITILVCLSYAGSQAQGFFGGFDESFSRASLRGKLDAKSEENVAGSPYSTEKFILSEISGVPMLVLVRYNGYRDEVEIKKDDEIYVLPKDTVYGEITPKNTNYKIKFLKNITVKGEDRKGYFFSLFDKNNVELLKKDRVVVQKAKESDNSYGVSEPSKYIKAKLEYYIKRNDGSVMEFPKGKKELIALYPAKKAEIEAFLKENKVSFKEEKDMVKITEFIASL